MCDCDCEHCQYCEDDEDYDFGPIDWDDLTPMERYVYHYLYPKQTNLYEQLTRYNENTFNFRRE